MKRMRMKKMTHNYVSVVKTIIQGYHLYDLWCEIQQKHMHTNQVVSIVDLADSKDRYNTFEYTDISSYMGAKNEKITYDSNGNMTSDNNRGISAIRYNLLNLPDTIQFAEGGQIINVYSAEGIKYRTEYIIPKKSILLPLGTIAHYTIDTIQSDRQEILYDGNWEQRRIHLDSWGDRFLHAYNLQPGRLYQVQGCKRKNDKSADVLLPKGPFRK